MRRTIEDSVDLYLAIVVCTRYYRDVRKESCNIVGKRSHTLMERTSSSIDQPPSIAASRFLRACSCQSVDRTPIWLMRQAGRYMSEYRRLREKYPILEIIKTPELACEVTMQPLKVLDVDA